jgi:membrane-bound lytic murein transglycosylase B
MYNKSMRSYAHLIVFLAAFLFLPFFSFAQSLSPEQKAQLEKELAAVEAEQKAAEKELVNAQAKSTSLANDIALLNAKIKTAQLNIKAKTLLIQTLGNDIVSKQKHIDNLELHISKGKESLAGVLRKTNELGSYSLPEVLLSQKTVAGFFQDIDTFDSVHESMQEVFSGLRSDELETTAEKEALDARRNKEMDAKYTIEEEKKNIEGDETQKQQLLSVSKGNEKSYSSIIAQKKALAAKIRAQLFSLRDAAAIPFGQAYQYAVSASQKTDVRPALILAILTQESNLGSNVGQCYVIDTTTGAGISAKTGASIQKVMSPTRDVPVFLELLQILGGDYAKTVVSCPQSIGWGGAMGPSQFIPSTWKLMSGQIAEAVGISGMPDPWNPAHAIMATALYLSDRGAVTGSYTAERNAACKYYSGSSCGVVSGASTYGNSVMALADKIQRTMIDPLQGI